MALRMNRAAKRARRAARQRRVRRIGRSKRGLRQPVHYFKQSIYSMGSVVASSSGDSFVNFTFTVANLPNLTALTSLYDQYCIKGIKVRIIPRFNSADVVSTTQPPALWSIIDYDGTYPTTLDGLTQYQNLKITRGTGEHTRYLKPKLLNYIYQTSVGNAYTPRANQWVDCANSTVAHYGMCVGVPQIFVGDSCKWDTIVTYYLAFKNVR